MAGEDCSGRGRRNGGQRDPGEHGHEHDQRDDIGDCRRGDATHRDDLAPFVAIGMEQGLVNNVRLQIPKMAAGQTGTLFNRGQQARAQLGERGFDLPSNPAEVAGGGGGQPDADTCEGEGHHAQDWHSGIQRPREADLQAP